MFRVTHYLRKPRVGNYSIERLYADVREFLPEEIQTTTCVNRFLSNGVFRRLYDVIRAYWWQGDVNHVTGDVHYLTYLLDRRRTVLTIHDCVTLERLSGLKRWIFWFFWYWLPVKKSSVIVVISKATRNELLRYIPSAKNKIHIIYNNVSKEFQPSPMIFNSNKPRILLVGTKVNKNIDRLVKAINGLSCKLIIVGQLSNLQVSLLKKHKISYENYYSLSRQALVHQYQFCDILFFASTYEGFGLPIVEANAIGRPVITSNILSMPEVAGKACCLVDPFDVSSIRAGILRVINDTDYREHLVELGFENVKRFQSEYIAEQYAQLYRDINKQVKNVHN